MVQEFVNDNIFLQKEAAGNSSSRQLEALSRILKFSKDGLMNNRHMHRRLEVDKYATDVR